MKTALQYFFANNWPTKIYLGSAVALGLFVGIIICKAGFSELTHLYDIFLFCIIPLIVCPILFFFLSLPYAFVVLGPLFHLGAKLNGAPFNVGDRVRILVGPHRNEIVKIYAIWKERNQVRVELDDLAKEKVKDVFSFVEVCCERAA